MADAYIFDVPVWGYSVAVLVHVSQCGVYRSVYFLSSVWYYHTLVQPYRSLTVQFSDVVSYANDHLNI